MFRLSARRVAFLRTLHSLALGRRFPPSRLLPDPFDVLRVKEGLP
jgi:hypothetical protein